MAQRLATNYANASFVMTEQELEQFVELFANEKITIKVKVCDNGDRDIFIEDRGREVQLPFRRSGNIFVCDTSYVINDLGLANVMRKAMKIFKGHGIVHRIYESFTVVYYYDEGSVIRIEDVSEDQQSNIFEATQKDYAKELECLFANMGGEQEIALLRIEADKLLDLRNFAKTATPKKLPSIDRKLTAISRRLFELEA